jgi:thioesterase domain-containing protein
LARYLGSDATIYGIQAAGVHVEIDSFTKIEDMAAEYVAALRVLQPHGPYFLGGTSFGGAVAFEIAQQLSALDEKIALLALMDTPGPGLTPPKLTEDVEILAYAFSASADLAIPLEEIRKLPPDEQLFYFLEQKEIANTILPDLTPTQVRQLLHLSKVNRQAMLNYKPGKYPGQIIFFRASEHDGYSPENPELPWLELATLGVKVVEVPGNHFTMNYPPHVQILAQKLRVYLDEARRLGIVQE